MNVESLREFCLSLPQVTECFPFDEWVLVFKIEGKMFLFCDLSAEEKRISLKCDPELAIELRERYPEIEPGYHTNKRLWNSIWLRPSIDDKVICDCIVHAYSEVLKKLPRIKREPLSELLETFQKTHLKEIGSTNTYLQESDKDRLLPEGTIVYCDIQRSGRGQRGNSWESEPFKNLTFSLLLRPEHIPANRQFLLSEIVSLATVDVLNRYATGFSIKWPNDIYWHDKKIAGILIENVLSGSTFSRAIIGMGLNINQKNFYSDAPNPVSLYQITGRTYKIEKILDEFTEAFGKRYTDTFTNSSDRIHKEYIAALYRNDGVYPFYSDGNIFHASIADVELDGHLLLSTESGEKKRFAFKEVSFLL